MKLYQNLNVTGSITLSGSMNLVGPNNHNFTGSVLVSGSVGINGSPGTSFPLETYINSSTIYTTSSRGNVFRVYNPNTSANVYAGIELGAAGSTNDGLVGINGIVTGNGSGDMAFYTRNSSTFSEKVRITSGGVVGIGTTSLKSWISSYKALEIGAGWGMMASAANYDGYICSNLYYDGNWKVATDPSIKPFMLKLGNEFSIQIGTTAAVNSVSTLTTALTVTNTGLVGINASSPATQFQVRKNYWQFWTEKTFNSNVNLFSLTFPASQGGAIVQFAGSRYSPGADNYSGVATYYVYCSNVGVINVTTSSSAGTYGLSTSISGTTITFFAAYAGTSTNYTGVSVSILASGHSNGSESAVTVSVL